MTIFHSIHLIGFYIYECIYHFYQLKQIRRESHNSRRWFVFILSWGNWLYFFLVILVRSVFFLSYLFYYFIWLFYSVVWWRAQESTAMSSFEPWNLVCMWHRSGSFDSFRVLSRWMRSKSNNIDCSQSLPLGNLYTKRS